MRITRDTGMVRTVWDIDFSRRLLFYSMVGFAVPVQMSQPGKNNIIFVWSTDSAVITVDGMKYRLDPGNPKEYERLKNNVITLFALNGLE